MINWIGELIGSVPKAIGDYFTEKLRTDSAEKLRKMELEDALHKRRIELISQGLAADASWEIEQIRNSGSKDEWVLAMLSIPLIGCFIPFTAPWILQGFQVLGNTPEWYRWLILLIFTAIFGIRIWRRQQSDT